MTSTPRPYPGDPHRADRDQSGLDQIGLAPSGSDWSGADHDGLDRAGSDPAESDPAESDPAEPGAAAPDFHAWRRSRPFWGGLLMLLSGIELFLSANLNLLEMKVHIGPTGFLSYVLPIMLVLCGVLALLTPAQRMFYGVLGVVVALYSLIGLNLGGFVLGLVLGVVGGALAVSWTPSVVSGTPSVVSGTPDPAALADGAGTAPAGGAAATGAATPAGHRRRTRPTIWPFGLILAVLVVPVTPADRPASAAAVPAGVGAGVRLAADADPVIESPAPSSPPADQPSASPSADPSSSTSPSGPAPDGPPPASPKPDGPPPAGTGPAAETGPAAAAVAAPPGQPAVNQLPSKMRADRLTMTELHYDGVVDLPTKDGTVRALLFTMKTSVSTPFSLDVPVGSNGKAMSVRSDSLTVDGNVKFYTSRFKGKLAGFIPVNFTPTSPPLLTPKNPTFTDAEIDLVYVQSDSLGAPGMTLANQ